MKSTRRGVTCLVALTANDEVNAMAALHFAERFGRDEVYQLPSRDEGAGRSEGLPRHLRGRYLFGAERHYDHMAELFDRGYTVKTTPLTDEFGYHDFQERYHRSAVPLFIVGEGGAVRAVTAGQKPAPRSEEKLIGLVLEEKPAGKETPVWCKTK